ncbi:serine hydrolase [bacterium]|nr:serine hydrolase [bacterium]
MKKLLLFTLILSSGFILNSCKEKDNGPKSLASNQPVFNMDLFEQNIIDYVNAGGDQPIGWAYVITQNGLLERFDAFGDARTSADGQIDFSLSKEINVASISKFYTAIAVLQLLEARNLDIDSKIAPWLPNSWVKGPGVNDLSFKDLLKHESGLNSINSNFDSTLSYSGLESCIEDGVVNPKTRLYLNVNFALFRVLIPSLWDGLDDAPETIDIESSPNTQIMYLWYMQQHIFSPIGLQFVNCSPEDRQEATLYYNVNDDNINANGSYYGSWSHMSGGGGYFMTPLEMAAVNAYYEHTEIILSDEMKAVMKEHRMGFDTQSSREEHGSYYGKNGSIANGANQGVLGQIVLFPFNDVEIVVIMNTQGVTLNVSNNFIGSMIYEAYNDAWEEP